MADEVYVEKRFNDFAECTDYYYEELGKLSQVPEITKREKKKLKKIIKASLFASIKVLKTEEKQLNEMAKTMDKELYSDFKSSRDNKPGVFSKIKQFFNKFKKVEVLDESETKLIENNNSSIEIIEEKQNTNSGKSKNFKSEKSDNAKGEGEAPASHDDEPMKF